MERHEEQREEQQEDRLREQVRAHAGRRHSDILPTGRLRVGIRRQALTGGLKLRQAARDGPPSRASRQHKQDGLGSQVGDRTFDAAFSAAIGLEISTRSEQQRQGLLQLASE